MRHGFDDKFACHMESWTLNEPFQRFLHVFNNLIRCDIVRLSHSLVTSQLQKDRPCNYGAGSVMCENHNARCDFLNR